jgi:hypothetical protein
MSPSNWKKKLNFPYYVPCFKVYHNPSRPPTRPNTRPPTGSSARPPTTPSSSSRPTSRDYSSSPASPSSFSHHPFITKVTTTVSSIITIISADALYPLSLSPNSSYYIPLPTPTPKLVSPLCSSSFLPNPTSSSPQHSPTHSSDSSSFSYSFSSQPPPPTNFRFDMVKSMFDEPLTHSLFLLNLPPYIPNYYFYHLLSSIGEVVLFVSTFREKFGFLICSFYDIRAALITYEFLTLKTTAYNIKVYFFFFFIFNRLIYDFFFLSF